MSAYGLSDEDIVRMSTRSRSVLGELPVTTGHGIAYRQVPVDPEITLGSMALLVSETRRMTKLMKESEPDPRHPKYLTQTEFENLLIDSEANLETFGTYLPSLEKENIHPRFLLNRGIDHEDLVERINYLIRQMLRLSVTVDAMKVTYRMRWRVRYRS